VSPNGAVNRSQIGNFVPIAIVRAALFDTNLLRVIIFVGAPSKRLQTASLLHSPGILPLASCSVNSGDGTGENA